jgi:hypothetical protein
MSRMSVAEDRPTGDGNSRPSGPKPFSGDLRSRFTICVQCRPATIMVDRGRQSFELLPGGKYFFDSAKLSRCVEQREKNDVVALYLVTRAKMTQCGLLCWLCAKLICFSPCFFSSPCRSARSSSPSKTLRHQPRSRSRLVWRCTRLLFTSSVVFLLLGFYFYEPHIKLAFYSRNWVTTRIEPIAPLRGCFGPPPRTKMHYATSPMLSGAHERWRCTVG